ncbi:hypothetical protein BOC46_28945 [Burkholderia pseudomallei]|nr:hypothetical protein BOC46_28945 [Burkholderia pseudomallei]ARM04389.1 hypothetical protein BOC59_32565 [Burkholderia pseudomallei]QDH31800.1 hypothetical protein FKO42_31830 [Burkholderia pseudomallei]
MTGAAARTGGTPPAAAFASSVPTATIAPAAVLIPASSARFARRTPRGPDPHATLATLGPIS